MCSDCPPSKSASTTGSWHVLASAALAGCGKRIGPKAAADVADDGGGQNDDGKRHVVKKIATKAAPAMATISLVLRAFFPMRTRLRSRWPARPA
jgi:hypothetical protein